MEVTKDQAEVWHYKPDKSDNPKNAQFYGWSRRRHAYRHARCQRYFTSLHESHRCLHWSIKHDKLKERWQKEVKAGLR